MVDRPSERLIYLHVDSHRPQGPGIIGLDKNPLADLRVRKLCLWPSTAIPS